MHDLLTETGVLTIHPKHLSEGTQEKQFKFPTKKKYFYTKKWLDYKNMFILGYFIIFRKGILLGHNMNL